MAATISADLLQRWQRLSKGQRLAAALAGTALAAWLVDAAALRPLRRHVLGLQAEVRQTEQQLLAAVAATHNAEAVTQALKAYAPYVQPSGPEDAGVAGLMSEVESTLRESGAYLVSQRQAGNRDAAGHAISVNIDIESTPGQLVKFLDRLARSASLLKVAELTVRVSENKTLRASMVVSKLLLK